MNNSEKHLIEYLRDEHKITITEKDVKDFSLDGTEPLEEVEQYADDYASECDTDEAEYRATAQERYDDLHERENVMSERIERFRNEI